VTALLGIIRAPFLVVTPACVAIGVATAWRQTGAIEWLNVVIVLAGGLCAHVCVNAFNEYFDFRSGLDSRTTRTPFSGGSGSLQARPDLATAALLLSCAAFLAVAVGSAYFVLLRGWLLIPLVAGGLFLLVTYTTWWVYNPITCLLAPGIGFGVLMVLSVHFCLAGAYSTTALVASLVPTFLVSDLLLLNQFPDAEADRSVGRRHFPITVGPRASSTIYGVFLLLNYLAVIGGVATGTLPVAGLLALLTVFLAVPAWLGARRNAENVPALVPSMGLNVIITVATPALLAVGLFIG
jgi:1,4-dihydroxy-2-naphthoate octaprenyltransferase